MADLVTGTPRHQPLKALVEAEALRRGVAEFFLAQVRNPHTRRTYMAALKRLALWAEGQGFTLTQLDTVHLGIYVEEFSSAPTTVKAHLSAIKAFYAYLHSRGVLQQNPALSVRGPRFSRERGATRAFSPDELRRLLESMERGGLIDLRDHALCTVMAFSAARIGAVCRLRVRDFMVEGTSSWLRLQEKRGREVVLPCHHLIGQSLGRYLRAARIEDDRDGPLFRPARGGAEELKPEPFHPNNALRMVKRRCQRLKIKGWHELCNHSFRTAAITSFLEHGGTLETAQRLAGHKDPRTTKIYDRRDDALQQSEIERIRY